MELFSIRIQRTFQLVSTRKMLAHKGFTPKYGARQVGGVIRNYLRRPISRLIINEELGKGKSLEVGLDEQNELIWNIHQ